VSINPKARGKKVNIYRLTRAGRKFIEDRQAARIEQRSAA
jgi:DNA-binding PadR family transcriptional regulator